MSLIKDKLQAAVAPDSLKNFTFTPPSDLLAKFSNTPIFKAGSKSNTIDIFDFIGSDGWGGGYGLSDLTEDLESATTSEPLKVRLNSPGGSVSDGVSMFNILRDWEGQVDIEVLGMAASAASIIAMSGDNINMGIGSEMMIHNAWGMVIGNQFDLQDAIPVFQSVDQSLRDVYVSRTGVDEAEIEEMMKATTFMTAKEAVEKGFATSVGGKADTVDVEASADASTTVARRRIEASLAKDGISSNDLSTMLSQAFAGFEGKPPEPIFSAAQFNELAGIFGKEKD